MPACDDIERKLDDDTPLDRDDGVFLYRFPDLCALGSLANRVRERLHGDRTYFNVNFHINATNVCHADCKFCSFARLEDGHAGGVHDEPRSRSAAS